MEFGVIPNYEWPADGDPHAQFRRTLEQARATVESGYDCVWFGQHYLSEGYNRFQLLPSLARIAGVADGTGVDLGTSVFLLPLHNPVELAEHVATLDAGFDGDLRFGVALGYKPAEFEAFGIDPDDRVGRLVEGVRLLRSLWTEDEVRFDGRHFSVDGASIDPKPAGGEGVPVWIGGNADRSVARAGRLGDGWIISARTGVEEAGRLAGVYRDAVADSDRPSRGIAMNREVFVADTTEAAVEAVRPMMKTRAQKWLDRGAADTAAEVADLDAQVDAMLEERFVGSPEAVIERVARYREEAGVDHVICMYNWRDLPQEAMVESIERFAETVVPYFRDEDADL